LTFSLQTQFLTLPICFPTAESVSKESIEEDISATILQLSDLKPFDSQLAGHIFKQGKSKLS